MKWLAYIGAWLAGALLWALASASSSNQSPLATLPYGVLVMTVAGTMGLVVWRLTQRVPWNWRSPSFYAVHGAGMAIYSVVYATSWTWPDLIGGRLDAAVTALRMVLFWNLLMGSWLYLVVAGLSYAILANRRVHAEAAAAAEARLLAQQAQLAALRAQINPHFLFNALHSVGALVSSDPGRADRALERLGDLLRYALRTEDEVLFADEWKFTHDYLAFEQLRLGERLVVDAAADAATMAVSVPPLLLQPLVENAVRHGIADRPAGGRIDLRAAMDDGRLHVTVVDDGAGAEEASKDGVGLTSVRRRLAALYGDRASLSFERSPGRFAVHFTIPVKELDQLDSVA